MNTFFVKYEYILNLEFNETFEFVDSWFSLNLRNFQKLFLQIIPLPLSLYFTFLNSHNVVSLKPLRHHSLFFYFLFISNSFSLQICLFFLLSVSYLDYCGFLTSEFLLGSCYDFTFLLIVTICIQFSLIFYLFSPLVHWVYSG